MRKKIRRTAFGLFLLIFFATLILFYSRQDNKVPEGYRYLIGLSLPNASVSVHNRLIREVNERKEAGEDLNILTKEAGDSAKRQRKDIEELMQYGIDLLVISPIFDESILEKLKELPVPVIILHERKAMEVADVFLGYDNMGAGKLLADFLERQQEERAPLLYLSGNAGETAAEERKVGFLENISSERRENTEVISCHWSRNEAENSMKSYLVSGKKVLTVVAANDTMAFGARLATQKLRIHGIFICGIDGFDVKNEGMDLLRKGMIGATVRFENMYEAMTETARALLDRKDHPKEKILKAELVTR